MTGQTLARIYAGTPEQQDAAFAADQVGAAQNGWRPVRYERMPDSMRVTYEQAASGEWSTAAPGLEAQAPTLQAPAPGAETGVPILPPERPDRLPPKAQRPYAWTTCPYCKVEQVKVPKAKKVCPDCGRPIFVRSGSDGYIYLLSEAELPAFDATMSSYQEQQDAQAEAEDRQALLAAGFVVGEDYVEVVGESHYQRELLRIVGGRTERGAHHRCAAELVREPTNRHDPDAVMVVIAGVTVGYVNRDEAFDVAEMVGRMQTSGRRVWVPATIVGGWRGVRGTGHFGVQLDGLPLYE